MDAELRKLEDELKRFSPTPVSGDVLSRMVDAMDNWEDSESGSRDKVVPFPGSQKKGASWMPMWAAAAAVAILGGLIGVLLPMGAGEQEIMALRNLGPVPIVKQASFVPVQTERKVNSVNAGVISDERGVYQVIQIVGQDEARFERQAGNVGLKISRPKVNVYVTPVSY